MGGNHRFHKWRRETFRIWRGANSTPIFGDCYSFFALKTRWRKFLHCAEKDEHFSRQRFEDGVAHRSGIS